MKRVCSLVLVALLSGTAACKADNGRKCKDGTSSHAKQGACSGHGGLR